MILPIFRIKEFQLKSNIMGYHVYNKEILKPVIRRTSYKNGTEKSDG